MTPTERVVFEEERLAKSKHDRQEKRVSLGLEELAAETEKAAAGRRAARRDPVRGPANRLRVNGNAASRW